MFVALALATQLACVHVTVKPGDTLSRIATDHGKTWRSIWQENPFIKDPDLIYPGQDLTICDASLDVVSQTTQATRYPQVTHNQPCQSWQMFPNGDISMWEIPIGCYAGVYTENKGDCFGWIRYLLGNDLSQVARAVPGVAVHIPPGNQGASSVGHWAYILGIDRTPDGHTWALISEENMYWRGGGYNRVSYRYLLLTPDMLYYR